MSICSHLNSSFIIRPSHELVWVAPGGFGSEKSQPLTGSHMTGHVPGCGPDRLGPVQLIADLAHH